MTIKQYNQKFQKINLLEAVKAVIIQSEKEIVNLQAIQLSKGETKQGGELPHYSNTSVEFFGKQPGPWTGKQTGSLYKGLQIASIDDKGFEIISSSDTYPLFVKQLKRKKYSVTDAFGLNKKARKGGATNESLPDVLKPRLKKEIEKQTGLKL
jgi:hypothetical protein